MPTYCRDKEDCKRSAMCDYCKYKTIGIMPHAYCHKHNKAVDMADYCKDFHCKFAKEVTPTREGPENASSTDPE